MSMTCKWVLRTYRVSKKYPNISFVATIFLMLTLVVWARTWLYLLRGCPKPKGMRNVGLTIELSGWLRQGAQIDLGLAESCSFSYFWISLAAFDGSIGFAKSDDLLFKQTKGQVCNHHWIEELRLRRQGYAEALPLCQSSQSIER